MPSKSRRGPNRPAATQINVSYFLAGLAIAIPISVYALFVAFAMMASVQRLLVYSHAVHTLWWPGWDINRPEQWGFAKNQVTPFNLKTSDNETLYAWHILPLPVYAEHEERISTQPSGLSKDITQTENFQVLKEDPNARLVIYFHGNAGHIAQAFRPACYHSLTDTSSYHLVVIDYRGFGLSTGSPTEEGVILDGRAVVDWAINTAGVPAERIVLLGQSLGTAVTSAVAAHYASEYDFAGVVLVAGFSSLPTMLAEYRIGGLIHALGPLKAWPWLLKQVLGSVVDKWASVDRLRIVTRAVKERKGRLRLSMVHASDDWDIPCAEDDKLFAAAVSGLAEGEAETGYDVEALKPEKAKRTIVKGENSFVATWTDGNVVIRQELAPYGGHNYIMAHAAVTQAVMRSFDLIGTGEARS